MMGVKYLKKGFYQEKNELIDKTVKKYAEAKNNNKLTMNEIENIRRNSIGILGNIMVENGFRDEEENFISIDKDFFNEHDQLDENKLIDFQKLMIRHYALQDIKWTFAGTTSCFTQITKKFLKERNVDYIDLLPVELKRKYIENMQKKHKNKNPNTYTVFLYPDGSISEKYDPDKAKITFENIRDKSGFNWSKGYSPDNKVKKIGWTAGFNKNSEWERIQLDKKSTSLDVSAAVDPSIIFTDRFKKNENDLSFVSIPESDEVILFDHSSKLMDGEEQRYYSVTGELYGVREIDKENSIKGIKNSLNQQEINKLTGIVVSKKDKKTIDYYKNKFAGFITENTQFYTRGDKKLKEKLSNLKKEIEGKEVSESILSGFFSLAQKGIKGEELYDGLIPGIKKSEYSINLNIFNTREDLETFVRLPEIEKERDDETKKFLNTIKIPETKKVMFSNAVQNILHNYKSVFKHANIKKTQLLKAAYDVVVNNNTKSVGNASIVREKNLREFINENGSVTKKTDIPSFKKAFKKNEDYYNIFDEKELDEWANKELKNQPFSDDSIKEVKNIILNAKVPEHKKINYSRVVQNTFESLPTIATSTGIAPVELANIINELIINNNIGDKYKNKRIYFEKNLASLITESSKNNPNKITIYKEDIYLTKKGEVLERGLDLLNETALNTFALSPFMSNNGIEDEESKEIIDHLRQIKIPSYKTRQFTKGVVNTIKSYKNHIASKGITPVKAIKSVANAIRGEYNKVPKEIENTILNSIKIKRETTKIDTPKLNLLNKNDLDTFIKSPEFKQSGMKESQLNDLITQHSDSYQGLQNRYFKEMPLRYKEVEASKEDKKTMSGVELSEALKYQKIPNDIYNIGWSTSQYGDGPKRVKFTDFGNKILNPMSKNKINYVTDYNSSVPEQARMTYKDLGGIIGDIQKQPILKKTTTDSSYHDDDRFVFVRPRAPESKSTNQQAGVVPSQQLQHNSAKSQTPITEEERMKRIEKNYYEDRQKLARSESQQMLSGGMNEFKGAKDDGNTINRAVDDAMRAAKQIITDKKAE